MPVTVSIPSERKSSNRIDFEVKAGLSQEKRTFYENDVDSEMGEEISWGDIEAGDVIQGLEVGRVVECRR